MDTYEKKYKEALEKIKNLIDKDHNDINVDDVLNIFPELVESEDEKISKEIIYFLSGNTLQFGEDIDKYKSWIAWLEKQGNKQQKTSIWKHWKDGIAGNGEGEPIYLIKYGRTYSLSSCLGFECDYIELSELDKLLSEKQGEQNLVIEMKSAEESLGIDSETYNKIVDECIFDEQKPADKVESKFKVGDWITDGYVGGQITSIEDNYPCYKIADFMGGINTSIPFTLQDNYHLWTIQDAKDGDVLCLYYNNRKTFFIFKAIIGEGDYADILVHCCYTGKYQYLEPSFNGECRMHQISDGGYCIPADKEEQGILFQKMKEAGYEWDAEKKELKKIEQKSQRMISAEAKEAMYDKPAWSEEDEEFLRRAINATKDAYPITANWLKSIKQRINV